ncbi:MAG: ATPase [Enterovirga sp.]|nr:ATPase [Enterovirga sp.]
MNNSAMSNRDTLSRAARRLLAALAEPDTSAIPDPTREGMFILRSTRRGVSLGRGAHPEAACRELERHDLALRADGGRCIAISEAGRRHLRRMAAGPAENGFLAQHAEIETGTIAGETGPAKVAINAAESPLDWLRRRKDRDGSPLIDSASYEAGERLRRDLTFGGMMPSVTARWEGALGSGSAGPRDPAAAADAVVAARQRVRNALSEVGQDFADLLVDICGFLKGLETIERERRWPARSGKVVVRLALRRLAEHYGLETEARGPGRSRGLRTWVAEEAAAR